MTVLNPFALLFAALAIPIVLLYLLRLKRREQSVSSTLLWRQVILDREANTLWQRLRRNLLMALQLLTLALLVLALIRPSIAVPGGLSGQQIVLLDASASMRATDVPPSRFEAAKAIVRGLIDRLGTHDSMMIIVVDNTPRALAGTTGNKAELYSLLDNAQPTIHPANWSAAIALAMASAGNSTAPITVVSDGANTSGGASPSPFSLLNDAARYLPVGANGDNLAINTLALRRTARGLAVLLRIANLGSADRSALVSLRIDGALVDARTFRVPAGQSTTWTVGNLNPQAQTVQAGLTAEAGNHLDVDDAAYAVNAYRQNRRALLLSPGNLFLEQALGSLPDVQVTRIMTRPLPGEAPNGFDLYILDGITLSLPSGANALYIGAAMPFAATGSFSNTGYVRTESHPVLESVDWRPVHVLSARAGAPPVWLKPVVQSQGGPLLYAGQAPAPAAPGANAVGRAVVIPFDLRFSDLPLQIAFPVLIANAVEWLAPAQGANLPDSIRPGEAVPLPSETQVELPDGTIALAGEDGFAHTDQPGIYHVNARGVRASFAVNFSPSAESDITPIPQLIASGAADGPSPDNNLTQNEIWSWLAILAVVMLLVEWWIYQRGLPWLAKKKNPASSGRRVSG